MCAKEDFISVILDNSFYSRSTDIFSVEELKKNNGNSYYYFFEGNGGRKGGGLEFSTSLWEIKQIFKALFLVDVLNDFSIEIIPESKRTKESTIIKASFRDLPKKDRSSYIIQKTKEFSKCLKKIQLFDKI